MNNQQLQQVKEILKEPNGKEILLAEIIAMYPFPEDKKERQDILKIAKTIVTI